MADLGFMPAVTRILDETPAGGQRMFFSATLDRGVGQLVTAYVRDPALHAVTSSTDAVPAEHRLLVLSAQDKVPVAAEIASGPGRTLFFVRTKHGADRLAKQLSRAGVDAAAIHGDRNQNQRQRALDAFSRRASPRPGRHRRGRPRHPRRRRRPGGAVRPAERPQGLPAPLGPHRPGRSHRHGRRAGRARPGPRASAAARRGGRDRGPARGRDRTPGGPGDRRVGHARPPAPQGRAASRPGRRLARQAWAGSSLRNRLPAGPPGGRRREEFARGTANPSRRPQKAGAPAKYAGKAA